MENLNKSMKLSLIFGFSGAALMPIIYEIYANISTGIGLFLAAVWAVLAGARFSLLKFREAFVGITCTIAYSGILGWVCYLFIHPRVVELLISRSVYFQLTFQQQLYFVACVFGISVGMYVLWAAKFGICMSVEKIKSNREKTGKYIDNAFDEGSDGL